MKRMMIIMILAALAACRSGDRSDAYGNFEATEVTVSSQAVGQLLEFEADEGAVLEKGMEIGVVDTTDLHLKLIQLKSQEKVLDARLRNIEAQLEVQHQQIRNLDVDKQRLEKLYKEGAATQKQMDDVKGAYDLLNVQLRSVEVQKSSVEAERTSLFSQQEQVRESIRKCRIYNPVKGTVLSRYARAGEIVGFGKPLYKIGDLDQLDLKVFVSGSILPHIKLGEEVQVLVDDTQKTNRALTGRISWISPKAEFTPKTIQTKEERVNLVYAVKVTVKNDGSLKIGMPGEVNFLNENK